MNKTEAVIISHSNLTSSIWYSDPPEVLTPLPDSLRHLWMLRTYIALSSVFP